MKLLLLAFCVSNWLGISLANNCDRQSITSFRSNGLSSGSVCSGQLIFAEDFDSLDELKWTHDLTLSGFGTGQFQYYINDRRVTYTKNGTLHIEPRLLSADKGEEFLYNGTIDIGQSCTESSDDGCKRTGQPGKVLNPILSARISTKVSFSFKYGRVEIKMKAPTGDWLWPAVSLLPINQEYGTWPRSGEVDIMESRGNIDMGYPFTATSSLHWGPDVAHDMCEKTRYPKGDGAGYHTVFHIFQLEWTPDRIHFSVDDHHYGTVTPPDGGFWQLGDLDKSGETNPWVGHDKMAPFDEQFYLAINLAVGGTNGYFPERYGKPWKNTDERFEALTKFWEDKKNWIDSWKMDTDESHMQIDSIRIYAL